MDNRDSRDSSSAFEELLKAQSATDLQRIAKVWGGAGNQRKEQSLITILLGLADPARVAALVSRLEPYELAALGFLRMQPNQATHASGLALALLSSGYTLPKPKQAHETVHAALIQNLTKHGLALIQHDPWNYSYSSMYGSDPLLVTDRRLTQHAPPFVPLPATVSTVAAPVDRRMRRPAQVALNLISVVEAIRSIGGLQVNKNRTVRVNDMRKLAKVLAWDMDQVAFDGLSFHTPVQALIEVFGQMQVLAINDQERLVIAPNNLATLPYDQLVRRVMGAFPGLASWYEYDLGYRSGLTARGTSAMRIGAIFTLGRIVAVTDFISVDSFSRMLFDQVGEYYSLAGPHPRVARPWNMHYGQRGVPQSAEAIQAAAQIWRAKQWEEWQKYEEVWLSYLLSGWAYFLGLVELGIEGGHITAFRLTDLGRAVLNPQAPAPVEQPTGPAWVVQPNFEITVYLDHASSTQIMSIERAADRIQTDVYTANYRLTRDSIARWLNQGDSIDTLITLLGEAIPQNVATTIRDWSGQFERITLRRKVGLLEYPSRAERDTALSTGVGGRPVGDYYIVLDMHAVPPKELSRALDYNLPPPVTLKLSEDGQVSAMQGPPDLLGRVLLDRWAIAENAGKWQLTAASVAAAAQQGYKVDELISALDQRNLKRTTPMLLKITLRSWAGSQPPTALGSMVIFQCRDLAVADALAGSRHLSAFLHDRIGPTSFLIAQADLPKLQAALAEIGITPADSPSS